MSEAADKAFREWIESVDETVPPTLETFDEWCHEAWRKAWQACESQRGHAEHRPATSVEPHTFEEIIQGVIETQDKADRRCWVGFLLAHERHTQEAIQERVRSAVAEMRERVVNVIGLYAAKFMQSRTSRVEIANEILKEINSLPIDSNPNWLEKQLLDARIAERERIAKVVRILGEKSWWDAPGWTLHVPKEYANALFDAVYSDLTAERQALEGK